VPPPTPSLRSPPCRQAPPAARLPVPPPPPQVSQYNVAVNGQTTGPYTVATLSQMAASGQFTRESLVWKAGMANWMTAGNVPELSAIFGQNTPPIPPVPPMS